MFWLLETAKAAEHGEKAQEQAAHHTPIIVELVNHYFGQPVYELQMKYTYPLWQSFFAKLIRRLRRCLVRIPRRPRFRGTR